MTEFTFLVEGIEGLATSFTLVGLTIEDAEFELLSGSLGLSPAYWTVHLTDLKKDYLKFI